MMPKGGLLLLACQVLRVFEVWVKSKPYLGKTWVAQVLHSQLASAPLAAAGAAARRRWGTNWSRPRPGGGGAGVSRKRRLQLLRLREVEQQVQAQNVMVGPPTKPRSASSTSRFHNLAFGGNRASLKLIDKNTISLIRSQHSMHHSQLSIQHHQEAFVRHMSRTWAGASTFIRWPSITVRSRETNQSFCLQWV